MKTKTQKVTSKPTLNEVLTKARGGFCGFEITNSKGSRSLNGRIVSSTDQYITIRPSKSEDTLKVRLSSLSRVSGGGQEFVA